MPLTFRHPFDDTVELEEIDPATLKPGDEFFCTTLLDGVRERAGPEAWSQPLAVAGQPLVVVAVEPGTVTAHASGEPFTWRHAPVPKHFAEPGPWVTADRRFFRRYQAVNDE